MGEVSLDVKIRKLGSKGDLAALRKIGKIPAVFYGKNTESKSISVDSKAFTSIIAANGANVIINLNFEEGNKSVIVKALQRDVMTQNPIHIDFHAISLENKVEVLIPVHINGVADGVKNSGGVMEFITREIKIKALPKNIPQKISIDVSTLGIGHRITVAELQKLEGIDYVQDLSTLIVHVVAVDNEKLTATTTIEESEIMQQPKVISKGKKDKSNEEGDLSSSITGGVKK